ncbi:TLD-domain-containing protein [Amylostereum chailletii]|nr:TLD-domain-containing protein [Amylostereum chailletii]
MASLKSIPPLIPLPAGSSSPAIDKDDAYASLFSPDTPPVSTTFSPSRPPLSPVHHRRSTSASSDFGAFVSVPADDHPLHDGGDDDAPATFAPLTDAPKPAQKGYLAEILAHEDDPLYWVRASGSGGSNTPVPQTTPPPSRPQPLTEAGPTLMDDLNDSLFNNLDLLPGALTALEPKPEPKPEPEPEPVPLSSRHSHSHSHSHSQSKSEPHTRHPTRLSNFSLPQPAPIPIPASDTPKSPIARSPSLPPSPSQLTAPVLTRTLSSSTFAQAPALPARWMSSLLSSTRSSTSSPHISPHPPHVSPNPPHHAPPHHATTLPAQDITHGSPFASHTLPPPSGAPGFVGDRNWDKGFEFEGAIERRSVRLLGRREGTSAVLDVGLADLIRPHLPALARLPKTWTLLYSLDQHGISLHTLYERCGAHIGGGALVVVRDAADAVFGAWMGEGVRREKGGYYGSGESFLWKMQADGGLKVFKWTGKNEYVALCEPDYISFGGGDGTYGLYLDDTLYDGSSARCPTFDNEPLCAPGPKKAGTGTVAFECVGLEVWGVGGA